MPPSRSPSRRRRSVRCIARFRDIRNARRVRCITGLWRVHRTGYVWRVTRLWSIRNTWHIRHIGHGRCGGRWRRRRLRIRDSNTGSYGSRGQSCRNRRSHFLSAVVHRSSFPSRSGCVFTMGNSCCEIAEEAESPRNARKPLHQRTIRGNPRSFSREFPTGTVTVTSSPFRRCGFPVRRCRGSGSSCNGCRRSAAV
ncbi:hypothetical protein MycrhN_4377 [Mycolicibacterium rhodesiae NBB3]|uniref:Uncharacterized protein n=1 Tax=Mycolicibacterium rhodesiae (strain NBB3) TaxID=710685 RepID=G8RLQ3_MYCRN|nr:hypothetical protein MycrhN_4377 [Mycolicibacterium rhodesiae NBB3]